MGSSIKRAYIELDVNQGPLKSDINRFYIDHQFFNISSIEVTHIENFLYFNLPER